MDVSIPYSNKVLRVSRIGWLVILLSVWAGSAARGSDFVPPDDPRLPQPNILLILVDDAGVDLIGAYEQILLAQRDKAYPDCGNDPDCRPEPACTPYIDQLAAQGMLFSRVWSNPLCSPSRAQILTGRHAFRTGLGRNVDPATLRFARPPLPWRLRDAGYQSVALGKWHMNTLESYDYNIATRRELVHPEFNQRCPGTTEYIGAGFDFRLGSVTNLGFIPSTGVSEGNYYSWEKNINGVPLPGYCRYATVDTIDDAIAMIDPSVTLSCTDPSRLPCVKVDEPQCDDFDVSGAPWFMYVALNAPHRPLHPGDPNACIDPSDPNCLNCGRAFESRGRRLWGREMVAMMDAQVGRLLQHVDLSTTYVIFASDNGTAETLIAPKLRYLSEDCGGGRAKGSVYEGGIHVPLIVAGPGVASGAVCDAPVAIIDLFATIAQLAGADPVTEDSVSLLPYFRDPQRPPMRPIVFTERFNRAFDGVCERMPTQQTHVRAVRGERFKLIRVTRNELVEEGCPGENRFELYALDEDPFEERNLLRNPDKLDDPEVMAPATTDDYCELRCELVRMGVDREGPDDVCNCCIGLEDLTQVLAQMGCIDNCAVCSGDVDGDCDVDFNDLVEVLRRFGTCDE